MYTHFPSRYTHLIFGSDHYLKILHFWSPIIKKSHVFFYIVDYLLLVDSTCSDFTYNSVSKKKDNTAGGMLLTRDGLCLWCSEWSSEYYNSTGQRQQTVNTVSISTSSAFLQDLDFFTGFDLI